MRCFNITGPCKPAEHYTVRREVLLVKGLDMARHGRFFTIFAPRQTGKTTFFQLLIEELKREPDYVPIWISFEAMHTLSNVHFYEGLTYHLQDEFNKQNIRMPHDITESLSLLRLFSELVTAGTKRKIVLIVDEIEGAPSAIIGELLHAFRTLYHKKENHCLHSLMLVGVSTIADLVVGPASPFNIVDQLHLGYFNEAEVYGLIDQYTAESGQAFAPEVRREVFENSGGQPGLVCALCKHLTEEMATDHAKPVEMAHFYQTLQHFLTDRYDFNITNIIRKAREKKSFMLKVLFGTQTIPFSVHDPDMAFLYANGVIADHDGEADVKVPLYRKALITAFRPLINGEADEYITNAREGVEEYVAGGELNVAGLLQKYDEYVRRRGFRAFDTEHLREGAWHYSLDGFIHFYIHELGGQTFVEVPSGRGRTDILILYENRKYVIETKIYRTPGHYKKGKKQLATYLATESLNEGFYVVFSSKHTEQDTLVEDEIVDGKRILTRVIRTRFERAGQA